LVKILAVLVSISSTMNFGFLLPSLTKAILMSSRTLASVGRYIECLPRSCCTSRYIISPRTTRNTWARTLRSFLTKKGQSGMMTLSSIHLKSSSIMFLELYVLRISSVLRPALSVNTIIIYEGFLCSLPPAAPQHILPIESPWMTRPTFVVGVERTDMTSFDELVKAFHKTDVIEDSLGTCADKDLVVLRRRSAEDDARDLIRERWGTWSVHDVGRVVELVNCNGFGDANTRFSNLFLKNRSHVEKVGAERTREALLCLLDIDVGLEERVKCAQAIYGSTCRGMFSSLLYVTDPSSYSPWFKAILRNLRRFRLVEGPPLRTTLTDYGRYCRVLGGLEEEHSIPPQLTDYVLTTWTDVWERHR
jgi:hypothetical protein